MKEDIDSIYSTFLNITCPLIDGIVAISKQLDQKGSRVVRFTNLPITHTIHSWLLLAGSLFGLFDKNHSRVFKKITMIGTQITIIIHNSH